MKMILTRAADPAGYVEALGGWQRPAVIALREVTREAAPALEERLKWRHLVYFGRGPVLLIRAEPSRVLFGFWRGKRLRTIEPRLQGSGKYELASLELHEDTPFGRSVALELVAEAVRLDAEEGDPTRVVGPGGS